MPHYSKNAKYTHTREEMISLLGSQRHLKHCLEPEKWEDNYGVLYDVRSGHRINLSAWNSFYEFGFSKELGRLIRRHDFMARRDLFPNIIPLYDPIEVVYRLMNKFALSCPFCGRTYGRHERDKPKNKYRFYYNRLFDTIPEGLWRMPSHVLFSVRSPACEPCFSAYYQHKLRGRLEPLISWDNHEEGLEMLASAFILVQMSILSERVTSIKRKAFKIKKQNKKEKTQK
jgi:hypothetical protein